MKAKLWISGSVCRVLVYGAQGQVIDTNSDWNNIASAQMALNNAYPEADQQVIRGDVREMDREWNSCVNGN